VTGSLRLTVELLESGISIAENTVATCMRGPSPVAEVMREAVSEYIETDYIGGPVRGPDDPRLTDVGSPP